MPIKDVVKVSRKTFINPRSWIGYDNVKASSSLLWRSFKVVFFTSPTTGAVKGENFEQAVQRLNLTETDLQDLSRTYLIFTSIFAAIGIILVIYCIWHLSKGHISAAIIALSLSTFVFAQAFVFHFWRFQIKWRKLGCTFDEWRRGKPNNGGAA